MPMTLEGACRCGAVRFTLASHTPVPYQRCYCTICRKTAGGGGYAINIMGVAGTLAVHGETAAYRARLRADDAAARPAAAAATSAHAAPARCGWPTRNGPRWCTPSPRP